MSIERLGGPGNLQQSYATFKNAPTLTAPTLARDARGCEMCEGEKIKTRAEFEHFYTRGDDEVLKMLKEHGRTAQPCDCGEEMCLGWKMAYPGEDRRHA